MPKLNVKLNLGVFEVGGEWEPDDSEEWAAWEMYVELVTRISVAELAAIAHENSGDVGSVIVPG